MERAIGSFLLSLPKTPHNVQRENSAKGLKRKGPTSNNLSKRSLSGKTNWQNCKTVKGLASGTAISAGAMALGETARSAVNRQAL